MSDNYKIALEQALEWIQSNYAVDAVFVCGSIIRGTANESSDFDIYVIHQGDFRQRVQKYFNGVPCEVFLNALEHAHKSFEDELKANRPCTAHMLATGIVYFDNKNIDTALLLDAAKKYVALSSGLTEQQITAYKYSIATAFEDATDVLHSDEASAQLLLNRTVSELIFFVYALNKVPLAGIKHRINGLIAIHPQVGTLVQQFYTAPDTAEKYRLTNDMLQELDISKNFFEWTSTRDK